MGLFEQVSVPLLWIDEQKARGNIERMLSVAAQNNVQFRPHFKTHQSIAVGNWFRDYSVDRITVSSVRMALYFSQHGWNDITIAFPVNTRELAEINYLAGRIRLNLIVEDLRTIQILANGLEQRTGCYVKIDIGAGRTGIYFKNFEEIEDCIRVIRKTPWLGFKGFLMHAGQTYEATSAERVREIFNSVAPGIVELKEHFTVNNGMVPELSYGDTPSCSTGCDLQIFDEIRPGNFVFYDLMQNAIGSCSREDIAVALTCPVVAVHKERNEVVLMGGAIHFGRDFLTNENGERVFGREVKQDDAKWNSEAKPGHLIRLSQEHGIVRMPESRIDDYCPGETMTILPVHSCMTAHYMGQYTTFKGRILDHFVRSKLYMQGLSGANIHVDN